MDLGMSKRNITLSISRETLRQAKFICAQRQISLSDFVAQQIERLFAEDGAYEHAKRDALALLEEGFHLGGSIQASRNEWHER